MLSIKKCQQLNPELKNLSEEEILQIRDSLYELGQLALENWKSNNSDSKSLGWLLPNNDK